MYLAEYIPVGAKLLLELLYTGATEMAQRTLEEHCELALKVMNV